MNLSHSIIIKSFSYLDRLPDVSEIYVASSESDSESNGSTMLRDDLDHARVRQVRRQIIANERGPIVRSIASAPALQAAIATTPSPVAPPAASAALAHHNGTAGRSSSNGTQPNVGQRQQLGGFVNAEGTAIRSSSHATTLIGILQLQLDMPKE